MRIFCPDCGMPLDFRVEISEVRKSPNMISISFYHARVEHRCEEQK